MALPRPAGPAAPGPAAPGPAAPGRPAAPDPAACLATCPLDTAVRLTGVDVEPGQRLRLAEFGLRTGASVRVLSKAAGGGRIVGVGTSRIALDRATAAALHVEVTGSAA